MALTGGLYSAAEAECFGLVNRVVPEGGALEKRPPNGDETPAVDGGGARGRGSAGRPNKSK